MIYKIFMQRTFRLFINVALFVYSVSCVFPVVWMTYSSLKTSAEFNQNIISMPAKLNFTNYVDAFKASRMAVYSFNSVFNALVSTAIVLLLAFVIAYFLARFEFKGRKSLYLLFIFGMLVPIHSLLVPIFIQFKNFGLFNTRWTLIVPYVAFGLPFAVFLFESFIRGIPKEMEEAAIIDGASFSRTLFTIILPLCRPVMVTVGILQFFSNWNEFPFALVLLSDDKLKTIPIGLLNFSGQYSSNYPLLMSGLMLATIPLIALYIIFHGKIIEGMTAGSVKG